MSPALVRLGAFMLGLASCNAFLAGRNLHSLRQQQPLAATKKGVKKSSFADKVEAGLLTIFKPKEVKRVVEAWRRMRKNQDVKKSLELFSEDGELHHLGVQECNSYISGLEPVKCFHSNESFLPWTKALEDSWPEIKDEFLSVIGDEAKLSQGSNVWVGPLAGDEVARAYGEQWKTFGLYDRAEWEEQNIQLFPVTTKALTASECPLVEALFARMAPGSSIKAHSDMSNFVLTAHLGVDVPTGDDGEPCCWIQVGNEKRYWENGKVMVFDTSILHEAANEHPTKDRYVLMLRVWHPMTTETERRALQFIFDACADDQLVASEEQLFVYKQLADARAGYYNDLLEKL